MRFNKIGFLGLTAAFLFILGGIGVGNGRALPLAPNAPIINSITTNAGDYPNNQIPQYDKFEITFQVDTVAGNLYLPYDAAPPAGVTPETGISVAAYFTPDNWQTTYIQPAFYYEEFQDAVKSGQAWFYPTGSSAWKVRFAPDQAGDWQYKLVAEDAGGSQTTASFSFTVVNSANKGFIHVSDNDPRYFVYDDGSYFPGLGYNLNYRAVDWINPESNSATFQTLSDNGIQLIRTWLSQWSIYGSAWSPWKSHNPAHQTQEPDVRLRHDAVLPDSLSGALPVARAESDVFLWLSYDETVFSGDKQWNFTPCMVMGWESPQIPLERSTDYRVRVRYKEEGLTGPKVAGQPFGFTVKTGGWMWDSSDETQRCYYPGVGTVRAATYSTTSSWSHYPDPDYPGWSILEGHFNSGSDDFINKFYLALENVNAGSVFVDYVWLEEDLGSGQYGPNLIY
ncbi:MAG: DUF5060 domain-containing protein, partial [Anaerolineae bacterium]